MAAPIDQPSVRVSKHDRLQVEVKVDCPIKVTRRKKLEYKVELYFLLPKVLGIGPGNTEIQTLYDDLRSFTRMKTPAASTARLASSDLHASPLARLVGLAKKGPGGSVTDNRVWNRSVRQEARLLARGYRSSTRDTIAALEAGHGVAPVRLLLDRSRKLTGGYRWAMAQLLAMDLEPETRLGLAACDEYLSVHVEHNLLIALRALQAAAEPGPRPDLAEEVLREARAEVAYRAEHGWPTVLGEEPTRGESERYVAQVTRLKKYVSRVLYLRQRPSATHALARHAILGIAAALAMIWAVTVQILLLLKLNVNLERGASPRVLVFVAALLVLAYILKDRIKATAGTYIARLLPRWLDDRWTLLFWRRGSKPIARVSEQMLLMPAEAVPHDVEAARRSAQGDPLGMLYNEDALRYERTVSVKPERARDDFNQFVGLNDILRFNVARWCRTLAGPEREVLGLSVEGTPRIHRLPNRYIVDVVVRTTIDGRTSPWKRGSLYLTQRGIERFDGPGLSDGAASLPFDSLDDGD